MCGSKDIFVQILPVVKSSLQLENSTTIGKILLCKWNEGDFKDRFTGLIKGVDFKDGTPKSVANLRERLEKEATSIIPQSLIHRLLKIELVAILGFTDPPAYEEYVYITHLSDETAEITDVSFNGNSCQWFDWEKIPFQEMPEDDHLWYPKVLQEGLKVTGSFTFGSSSETTLKSYNVDIVSQL